MQGHQLKLDYALKKMSHSNAEIKTQSTKIFVQSMLVVLEIQLIVR